MYHVIKYSSVLSHMLYDLLSYAVTFPNHFTQSFKGGSAGIFQFLRICHPVLQGLDRKVDNTLQPPKI